MEFYNKEKNVMIITLMMMMVVCKLAKYRQAGYVIQFVNQIVEMEYSYLLKNVMIQMKIQMMDVHLIAF